MAKYMLPPELLSALLFREKKPKDDGLAQLKRSLKFQEALEHIKEKKDKDKDKKHEHWATKPRWGVLQMWLITMGLFPIYGPIYYGLWKLAGVIMLK
jgi:hypothetical protein